MMRARWLQIGLIALTWHAPSLVHAERAAPRIRDAEPPSDDEAAWGEFGFRVQLRFGYERLGESLPAPSANAVSINVEPGFRLSPQWSVGAGLRYSVLFGNWTGLRWNTTADVTYHPVRSVQIAVGAGYGGIVADKTFVEGYTDPETNTYFPPQPAPNESQLQACSGHGAVLLARAGYLFVVGDLFSTGPVLQADLQATHCQADVFEPTTGAEVTRSEWWWHKSLLLSWAFAWR